MKVFARFRLVIQFKISRETQPLLERMFFLSVNQTDNCKNANLPPALKTARSNKYLELWPESRADYSCR